MPVGIFGGHNKVTSVLSQWRELYDWLSQGEQKGVKVPFTSCLDAKQLPLNTERSRVSVVTPKLRLIPVT